MSPTFWLTIQVKGRRIPFLLPIILPLILVVEILAIPVVAIYSIRKKEYFPLKLVSGLYLTRFMLAFMLHGGGFRVRVCDGDDVVRIGGRRKARQSRSLCPDAQDRG